MILVDLPETDYGRALALQESLVRKKIARNGPDVLLLLEHPPTITLGVRGNPDDLRMSQEALSCDGIAIFKVDRGGAATYHGPGQIVCYPIMDLRARRLTLRDYVHGLEETIIRTVGAFGIRGERVKGAAGVWAGSSMKLASIGVKVERRITFHGFSLNVKLDRDPGDMIISCGMPHVRMVDMAALCGTQPEASAVRARIRRSFEEVFQVQLEPCPPHELDQRMESSDRVCS